MAAGYKTGGRKKGTPNKATEEARSAISMFVEGNSDRLQSWLDEVAEESPERAFNMFMKVVEYHIPKMRATDSTLTVDGEIGVREVVKQYVGSRTDD